VLVFYSVLRASSRYPWIMNYLRANDVRGGYGGYPWNGSGVMNGPVPARARLLATLRVLSVTGSPKRTLFYLPEISGCWKLDGRPCDGKLSVDWPSADVTRYICFILAPKTEPLCSSSQQHHCPPWHILSSDGSKVYRNDTLRFPYQCYMLHCYAPNDASAPDDELCDPWSNPVPQELMQLLPCAEWGEHGFPTVQGTGWIGAPDKLWRLDVGALGARVFLQGVEPAPVATARYKTSKLAHLPGVNRSWIGFELGPELMDAQEGGSTIRWEVQDVDVMV
jgi:hypothetical protein